MSHIKAAKGDFPHSYIKKTSWWNKNVLKSSYFPIYTYLAPHLATHVCKKKTLFIPKCEGLESVNKTFIWRRDGYRAKVTYSVH